MSSRSLTLDPRGPFSLAAAAEFLERFAPGGSAAADDGRGLRLAFAVEGGWETVGVRVMQAGDALRADVFGEADPDAVAAQLARLLSADVDAGGFTAVGARDRVVGELQARHPGLRPVGFCSPYEAACWALLSHRVRMTQAARLKQRLAEEHGRRIEVDGRPVAAFPAPGVLRSIDQVDGIPEIKLARLRAIADAALAGVLDGARLRALEPADALEELRELPGIGPFSAELILLRGAAHPDVFPRQERRLHLAMAAAYQLADPSIELLSAIADSWRPYRTWSAFLLRAHWEESQMRARA
jgi:DNA-3-methyladenine glycosylase II